MLTYWLYIKRTGLNGLNILILRSIGCEAVISVQCNFDVNFSDWYPDYFLPNMDDNERHKSRLAMCHYQGLYSLSGKTSYRKISWSLEAAKFGFDFSDRSEIWQAPSQQGCRGQITERYDHYNIQSRSFETSKHLGVRCLTAWWIEALNQSWQS